MEIAQTQMENNAIKDWTGKSPKKHLCRRCGRCFARREHLDRHDRSHTKEQPFRCEICPQAFTRKDLLKRHHRLNHEGTNRSGFVAVQTSREQVPASSHQLGFQRHFPNTVEHAPSVLLPALGGHTEEDLLASMPSLNAPQLWETGMDLFQYVALDDFDAFTDSLALPSHPYSPSHQPLPPLIDGLFNSFPAEVSLSNTSYGVQAVSEVHEPEGLSRYGSRLPSLDPEDYQSRKSNGPQHGATNCPRLTPTDMERLKLDLGAFSNVTSDVFTLPSRHTLNRFIHGYVRGFHRHYPLFHVPTMTVQGMPVELVLAIASVGAQYCFAHTTGFGLFYLAKSVAIERLRRHDVAGTPKDESADNAVSRLLHSVHTLLLLIAVSMWSENQPLFHEALSIRSVLERQLQNYALREFKIADPNDWAGWVTLESIKRASIITYCFFNMQTIIFDTPPMLLVQDIHVSLPCSEREWEAPTEEDWQRCREQHVKDISFQRAFSGLFANVEGDEGLIALSTVGSHGLIHAIIQRIWLLHQATRLPGCDGGLPQNDIAQLERVLKRWRISWEKDEEASATPSGARSAMSFTSTALLRLAYIRINMDSRTALPCLSSWNPEQIAATFAGMPNTQRSPRATRAALHCAHGLSIPIQLGIEFVARTQVFFWSNQYAMCSLESALFLTKWLEAVTLPYRREELSMEESRLLEFVLQMVAETEYAADPQYLLGTGRRLGGIILRLWAKLFRVDTAWEFPGLIGRSLLAYADLMEHTDILP